MCQKNIPSVNDVTDVPKGFSDWIADNAGRIDAAESGKGSLPYFIRDNRTVVDEILRMSDNPTFATKVKVGDREYLLKDLIAECRIEPTENGKIYVHPDHGNNELAENLEFARWRAETFGEEVILLPNPPGVKSADSFNITRGVTEEYKRSQEPTKNSIDYLVRSGKKQADYIIIEPHPEHMAKDVREALTSRINDRGEGRCTNIREIRVRIGDYEAVYTRDQIVSKGFKIKPEDFLNESAFRSQGARNNPISDAKLRNYFERWKWNLKN